MLCVCRAAETFLCKWRDLYTAGAHQASATRRASAAAGGCSSQVGFAVLHCSLLLVYGWSSLQETLSTGRGARVEAVPLCASWLQPLLYSHAPVVMQQQLRQSQQHMTQLSCTPGTLLIHSCCYKYKRLILPSYADADDTTTDWELLSRNF